MIKAVFLDIDGTIIDNGRGVPKVTDNTKKAIRMLQEKGIFVFIASGRSKCMLPLDIKNLGVDGFILTNGAYADFHGTKLLTHHIAHETIDVIKKSCEETNSVYFLVTQTWIYTKDINNELAQNFIKSWGLPDCYKNEDKERDYYIALAVCPDSEACDKLQEKIEGVCKPKRHQNFNSFDLDALHLSKGKGVKEVLSILNIDRAEAIAFGDGHNDIEMIKSVGCGIAMANAVDDLKKVADDMCGSVTEDGIYHYLIDKKII